MGKHALANKLALAKELAMSEKFHGRMAESDEVGKKQDMRAKT